MAKIDRLGWTAGIALTAYGLRIGIRVDRPDLLDDVHAMLPPAWKPAKSTVVDHLYSWIGGGAATSGARRFSVIYGGIVRLVRTMDVDEARRTLESDLHLLIAEEARRRLFIHAGVVGWNGKALLLPGRTFTGKTTLVRALVKAGATYYSDEYAVLDYNGRVYPYARPLGIRTQAGKSAPRPVEAMGGRVGKEPLPVGAIILTTYHRGSRWRPRRLSPGRATLALVANTVAARRKPRTALAVLPPLVSCVPVWKGPRGGAADTARSILARV